MKSQTNQANTKFVIHVSLVLVLDLTLAMALAIWLPVVSKSVEPVAGNEDAGADGHGKETNGRPQ